MKYVLVDTANTFFRARHVVRGELDIKVGMAFHITFNSLKKAWNDFDADHIVFCLEGRSWRKDVYAPYKRNRQESRDALTEAQAQEEKTFWETFDNFKNFITEKTNCTVLQHDELEADDLIAGWVQQHPNDEHVIISTDGDFAQLISPKVAQYNGVSNTTITHEGYFDDKGKRVIDNKTKLEKPAPNPEWLLFEKCMRGDSSDNVFSAFPKVRKNKLVEAFEDRNNKGFVWNNIMLSKWVDHEGNEHRVKEDYERNQQLIDLTQQPDGVKEHIFETIKQSTDNPKKIAQVGVFLLKLCHRYDLQRIKDNAQLYAEPLNARYGI